MSDCLFCRIAAGEVPSTPYYSDDAVYAFADIDPKAPFHAIVIPRAHIPSAAAVDGANSGDVARVFEAIARIAAEQGLDNGFRVVTNVGEDGGQTVPHLHFHLLGRRLLAWPPG